MDGFGVSVESIGRGAHGKSAPTAKSKPMPKSNFTVHSVVNSLAFDDSYSLPVDQLDGIFRSNFNIGKPQQPLNFLDGDYIFAGPASSSHQYGGVDLESVFCSSNNRKNKGSNLSSRNSVGFNAYDDLLGSMESKSKQRDLADDLIGSFGVNGKQDRKGEGFYDLIQGFGASPSKAKAYSETNGHPSNSSSAVIDDPFLVSESYVSQSDASWPFDGRSEQDTGKGSVLSSIDGFDDFIVGQARNSFKVEGTTTTSEKPSSGIALNGFENTDHLDAIFGDGNSWQWSNAARTSSTAENPPFDDFFHQEKRPEVKNTPSMSSFSTKKASSTNVGDDFTSLFGDVATSSGEFHEIEGEPKERRMARLNRHMRTNARMAEALAEKNQRDLQSQREQEEKRRLAETLDNDIKRWAAGKEGNLRALLSSLQQVLGPECGWRPVPITDMITSDSVKKVYKKATLYVHTDKVQQRGATLQQKYIAEKVFNLLKEAWNKFSMEELK